MFVYFLVPIVETDNSECCDIIGQSLMLAHNAVHSSHDQPHCVHSSHDQPSILQIPCQESQDKQLPAQKPLNDHYAGSHDQHGSHDLQTNSVCQTSIKSHNDNCKTPDTLGVANSTTATVTSNVPSKITFIDWTEMKRKNVTPPDYPSTPTPINVKLDQDGVIPSSNKKKKKSTNPTVSMCK